MEIRNVGVALLLAVAVGVVFLIAPGSAFARVHCASSSVGRGPGGPTIKAYAESAAGMRCKKVHQLLLASWIWRSGTLVSGVTSAGTPRDYRGAPGYPCKGKVYVPSPNFVLNQIQGASETCSRGNSNFSFTWGRRSRFTIPGIT
jgi:hypothetical protein